MSKSCDDKAEHTKAEAGLQEAIDRSDQELRVIANFYHQRGYLEGAQEIYRTLLRLDIKRNPTLPITGGKEAKKSA